MNSTAAARIIAVVGAVFFVGFGLWALLGPQSFFDEVATFEPYNEHLIHDVGAFQVGIGAVLAFSVLRLPGLVVALAGSSVGAVLHALSHFMDEDLGGKESDPWFMTFVAVVLIVGAVLAWRPTWSSRTR